MKPLAAIITFSLAICPLQADFWSSNVLMQKLSPLPSPPDSGWYIEEDGNTEILYSDGVEVSRLIKEDGQERLEDASGVSMRFFQDGLLVEEVESDGTEYTYTYDDVGNLERLERSKDGIIESVWQYNWTASGGLDAVVEITGDGATFYSGDLILESGIVHDRRTLGNEVSSDAYIPQCGSAERLEDGSTVVTTETEEGLEVSKYREDLRLESEELIGSDGESVSLATYSYNDDGSTRSVTRQEDGKRTVEIYEGRRIVQTLEYRNGELYSERTRLDDGTVLETRYRNGQAYATVHYDRDGLRVLSLEMS